MNVIQMDAICRAMFALDIAGSRIFLKILLLSTRKVYLRVYYVRRLFLCHTERIL